MRTTTVFDVPESTMRMEYECKLEEHDDTEGLMLQVLMTGASCVRKSIR